MKWLKILNPRAKRDAERAFWAIMFLPLFTRCIENELLNSDIELTGATIMRITTEVAMRVAEENFKPQEGFLGSVELLNAAHSLDYSSKAIAADVCIALHNGMIEKKIVNPLAASPFCQLMHKTFKENAEKALQGVQEGHLKMNEKIVLRIIANNLMEMPL